MVRRFSKAGTSGLVSVARLRLRRAARDIQSPADRVREDVIGAAFASDPRGLEYLIWAVCLRLEGDAYGHQKRNYASDEKCSSFRKTLLNRYCNIAPCIIFFITGAN